MPLAITPVFVPFLGFDDYLKDFTLEELNKTPEGFNNNLIWNLGHMLVTQQLLCYSLSYQEVIIPPEYIAKYRKGTRPSIPVDQEEVDHIRNLLQKTIGQTQSDFSNQTFEAYKPYETSYGIYITSIEEAIQFNNLHEAMHLGSILALMKFV